MPYSKEAVIFIEAPIFSKLVYDYLSEDEYAALQWALILKPDTGEVIPHSGGLRKVRWGGGGKGKRGGNRIIYYRQTAKGEIWLLTIYAKNEAENIPPQILRQIKEAMEL
jgi:mRNA-degrading endonuclease RelE of RelBE toxin-antitoxin system